MRCSTYIGVLFVTLSLFIEIKSFPTEGDMVVTPTSAGAPATELVPEKAGGSPITTIAPDTKLDLKPIIRSMHIESNVSSRYAKTRVTSRVSNPAGKANEVSFSIVIPETAFITGFSMEIEGKVYEAYVKEKEEAKKVYQDAVNSGQAAAHVAVKARDSNHFTVSVNLEPESKAIFRLYYEELLQRRLGLYNLIMNLNPGQIIDNLSVDVDIRENSPITHIYIPELRTGNEIDALPTDAQNRYASYVISEDRLNAKVHFAPSREDQIELIKLFKAKNAEMTTPPSRSYYSYIMNSAKENTPDGISGQFVVQYDVNRNVHGEVLVNDGYFVHFFAPENLEPLSKHVIFVLDVSGSMSGRKISQLKEAMISILQDLNPGDYFNILDFSYAAKVYNLDDPTKNAVYRSYQSYYYYDEPQSTQAPPEIPPKPKKASPENIKKAKDIIQQLNASGGTNIHDALTTALKIANYGISTQQADEKTESLRHEPMIIFLTDGEPTVGETNLDVIIKNVTELNDKKTAIFSLAFGEDADRTFLKKISLKNYGFLRHIYEAADAAQQLKYFYRQISSPLLANIKYTYPEDQIDAESITRSKFDHFFMGSELVIAGKLLPSAVINKPLKITGESRIGPIDYIPTIPFPEDKHKKKTFWPLERLWAYVTVKQLLDENDSNPDKAKEANGPAKKALDIALKYSFVTPLTSLVVVKPNSTSAVDAESLQNIPQSQSYPQASYALPLSGGLRGPPAFSGFASSGFTLSMAHAPLYQTSFMKRPPQYMPQITPTQQRIHMSVGGSSSYSYSGRRGRKFTGSRSRVPIIHSAAAPAAPARRPVSASQPVFQESAIFSDPIPSYDADESDMILGTNTGPATTTALPISELATYGLEKYQWLEKYLTKENTVVLPKTENTTLTYKLKKNTEKYDKYEEKPCENAIGGGAGVCKYLTDCDELDKGFKDLTTYLLHSCDANGFAGICSKVQEP